MKIISTTRMGVINAMADTIHNLTGEPKESLVRRCGDVWDRQWAKAEEIHTRLGEIRLVPMEGMPPDVALFVQDAR